MRAPPSPSCKLQPADGGCSQPEEQPSAPDKGGALPGMCAMPHLPPCLVHQPVGDWIQQDRNAWLETSSSQRLNTYEGYDF